MALGEGIALLEERVGAKMQARPAGLDPMSIIAAILAIITQFCTPRSMRRKLMNKPKLALRIYQEAHCSWETAVAAADDCFDLAAAANDTELQAVIDDCK